MKKKNKLKLLLISSLIIIGVLIIPSVYAFYFFEYESSIISRFLISGDLSNSYVRATVLTYWVDTTSCDDETDLTTCDISGKSSWNMNSNVINSDWVLLGDGYYYYKNIVNGDEIDEDSIKNTSISLIDSNLTLDDLTNDQLAGTDVIPQYEVIYEFIEKDSIENTWKVTYKNGFPSVI